MCSDFEPFVGFLDRIQQEPNFASNQFRPHHFREKLERAFYDAPISAVDVERALVSLIERFVEALGDRDLSVFLVPTIDFLDYLEHLNLAAVQESQLDSIGQSHPLAIKLWKWAMALCRQNKSNEPFQFLSEIESALDAAADCPFWQVQLSQVILKRVDRKPVDLVWRCCELIHFENLEHPHELMDYLVEIEDPNFARNAKKLTAEWTYDFLIESLPGSIQEPCHQISAIQFFAKTDRSIVAELMEYPITNSSPAVRETLVQCGFEPAQAHEETQPSLTRSEIAKLTERWTLEKLTEWHEEWAGRYAWTRYMESELEHGNPAPLAQWLRTIEDKAEGIGNYPHRCLLGDSSLELDKALRKCLSSAPAEELKVLLPGLQHFVGFPCPLDNTAQWDRELLFVHLLCDQALGYAAWAKSSQDFWLPGVESIWHLVESRADHFELSAPDRWDLAVSLCARAADANISYESDHEVDRSELNYAYLPDDLIGLVSAEQIDEHGKQLATIYSGEGETWRRIARIRGRLKQWQRAVDAIDQSMSETRDERIRQRRQAEKDLYHARAQQAD